MVAAAATAAVVTAVVARRQADKATRLAAVGSGRETMVRVDKEAVVAVAAVAGAVLHAEGTAATMVAAAATAAVVTAVVAPCRADRAA